MRNIKTIKVEKKDVEKLSSDELELLIDLKNHKGMEIIDKLAEDSIRRMVIESASNVDIDEKSARLFLQGISNMRLSIKFLLDAPERASEELKGRREKDG